MGDLTKCLHCSRPVMDKPGAKVCLACFSFGIAHLLDEDGLLRSELVDKTVTEIARFFGPQWEPFAFDYYKVVTGLTCTT